MESKTSEQFGDEGAAIEAQLLALRETRKELNELRAKVRSLEVQLAAASDPKSHFLADMSHEIRTPMNGVVGMAHLLLASGLNFQQKHYAEVLQGSAEALMGVLHDVLDFSKLQAGKLSVECKPFDLLEVVTEAVQHSGAAAYGKALEVFYRCPAWELQGDAVRLRQCLLAQVDAAVRATEQGYVALTVQGGEESSTVSFELADTRGKDGPAWDQEAESGVGINTLGLTVSRRLIELMGGRYEVDAESGTCRFTLPLPRLGDGGAAFADSGGTRVLILERSEAAGRATVELLSGWGMTPLLVTSESAALEALGEGFQGYLLDVRACTRDGEFLERILQLTAGEDSTLVLTGPPTSGGGSGLPQFSKEDYLAKPWAHEALFQKLHLSVEEEQVEETPTAVALPERMSGRVLLAEDTLVNQIVVGQFLEILGFQVDIATDGVQAVEAASTTVYDAILMDCQMPEMDGYDATRTIRDKEKPEAHTPIIAVTARVIDGEREKCLGVGMDDFLTKPVDFDSLQTVLRKYVCQ